MGGTAMSVLDRERISTLSISDSLGDLQFISFDVETTGLSPVVARLVELSGVKFKLFDAQVEIFSSLIDPETPIPPDVSKIHGITDDMVAEAPKCSEVVRQFAEWIEDERTVLVAHNAPFDVEFIQVAMTRARIERPINHVVDTLPLSRRLLNDAPNHQLKTLVEHLNLEAGGYHRALADSHHVRNVLERLVANQEMQTWGCLAEFGCIFPFDQDLYAVEPPAELLESISCITEAIASGNSLSFTYSGYRSFKRIVDPVALIQSRGNYYLTAYCKKALAERTFRVDRISKIKTIATGSAPSSPAEAAS
jgi:DNA polymerase III epsilon subunit family exonuclease